MKYIKTFEILSENEMKDAVSRYGIMKLKREFEYDKYPNKTYNNGNTLLMYACERKNLFLVNELIKFGADVNKQNNYGTTALMKIVGINSNYDNLGAKNKIVETLIENGANVNIKDNKGDTAIFYLTYQDYKTLGLLFNNGANIMHKNKYDMDFFEFYTFNNGTEIKTFVQENHPDKYNDYLISKDSEIYNL